MSRKKRRKNSLNARDKVVTKMTKDGLVEQNLTLNEEQRISNREVEFDLRGENISNGVDDVALDKTNAIVKSNDTPVKPNNQAASDSSSQVGTRITDSDSQSLGAKSGKRKTMQLRRNQTHMHKDSSETASPISSVPTNEVTALEYSELSKNNAHSFASQPTAGTSNEIVSESQSQRNILHKQSRILHFSKTGEQLAIPMEDETEMPTESTLAQSTKNRSIHQTRKESPLQHKTNTLTNDASEYNLADYTTGRRSQKQKYYQSQKETLALRNANLHDDTVNLHGSMDSDTNSHAAKHNARARRIRREQLTQNQAAEPVATKLQFPKDSINAITLPDTADFYMQAEIPSDQFAPIHEDNPLRQPRSPTAPTFVPPTRNKKPSAYRHNQDSAIVPAELIDVNITTSVDENIEATDIDKKTKSRDSPTHDSVDTLPHELESPKNSRKQKTSQPKSASASDSQQPSDKAEISKPNPKISKLEHRVDKTSAQLERAKNKLPSRRKIRIKSVLDEEKGTTKTRLTFEKETKSQREHIKGALPMRPVKFGVNAAIAKAHMKVHQVEDENVGVKAGHKAELVGESVVRSALRRHKTAPYRRVARLERKVSKQSAKLAYRRALEANPRIKKNPIARMWYKRKIKRQYTKQARQAQKTATKATKQAMTLKGKVIRLLQVAIKKNPKFWLILVVIVLVLFMIMSIMSLFSAIGSGGAGAMFISSYLAEDMDITNASVLYTELETDLRETIANIPSSHLGFDEYRINIDTNVINHNPLELMAYLTAVHLDFSNADISAHLQGLFGEQHQLIFTPSIEIRFQEGDDGSLVPHDWHVLTITLQSQSLTEIIYERLTEVQRAHYDILMGSLGNRQTIASPFDFNWHPFISSHFGYRIHPITGNRAFHGGIDIGLPTGTPIRAGHDGIVLFAGYNGGFGNLVILEGSDGLVTKYAHAHTLLVSTGQTVVAGEEIATVGSTGMSTGPHLHMEVLIFGQRMNPLFLVNPS